MNKLYVCSLALLITASAQAGLYRWVDESGNVHFSDKVPASASKKSHSKLNKSGDVTQNVDPELKLEKLKQIEVAKKEKLQQEEINRINAEKQAELRKRDENLLSTYEDEYELSTFFEKKISMVEGNNKILNAQNSFLTEKLESLKVKASSIKDVASLEKIAKKIVNINNTIEQYSIALEENNKQLNTIATNYKTDLTRFTELTKKQ